MNVIEAGRPDILIAKRVNAVCQIISISNVNAYDNSTKSVKSLESIGITP